MRVDDGEAATALKEEKVGNKEGEAVEDDLLEAACSSMQQIADVKEWSR